MKKQISQNIRMAVVPGQHNDWRPRFLSSNFLFYCLIALLALKLAILPFFILLPKTSFFAELTSEDLINLTNKERTSLGLSSLKENPSLSGAAFDKAEDMIHMGYFAHTSPEGKNPWYWFRRVGYNYQRAGENLAIGFLESREVFKAWDASLPHRKNIINPYYKDIGVAVVKGDFHGRQTTIVVQLFGSEMKDENKAGKAFAKESQGVGPAPEVGPAPGKHSSPNFVEGKIKEVKGGDASNSKIGNWEYNNAYGTISKPLSSVDNEHSSSMKFLRFIDDDYIGLINRAIYFSIAVVAVILFLTVFMTDTIPKDLILKTFFFIAVFSLMLVLNRNDILQLIPHTLSIY